MTATDTPPVSSPIWLRYRSEKARLDLRCTSAAEAREILQALSATFVEAPAMPQVATMVTPALQVEAASAVAAEKPVDRASLTYASERRAQLARWIEKQGGPVSPAKMFAAFREEYPTKEALSQMLIHWVRRDDCPLERIGKGYYRAKSRRGGVAASAPDAFRGGPGGEASPAGAEADLVEVGAGCA